MNWTDNRTEKLLNALEKNKCLHEEYRNILVRNNAFENIAKAMGPKFTMEDIKKKLEELAVNYNTNLLDVTAKESGAVTPVHTPTKGEKNKELYKLMKFLHPPPTPRQSTSFIDEASSSYVTAPALENIASQTQNIKDENVSPDLKVTLELRNLEIRGKNEGKKNVGKKT